MRLTELFEARMKDLVMKRMDDPEFHHPLFNRHPKPPKTEPKFVIYIKGKLWTKNGEPVSFSDRNVAEKAANYIGASRKISTQVIKL